MYESLSPCFPFFGVYLGVGFLESGNSINVWNNCQTVFHTATQSHTCNKGQKGDLSQILWTQSRTPSCHRPPPISFSFFPWAPPRQGEDRRREKASLSRGSLMGRAAGTHLSPGLEGCEGLSQSLLTKGDM